MQYNTVVIALTNKCPITCRMCFNDSGMHRKEEMKLDDALRYVEEAVSIGAKNFGISGGEPFLCPEKLEKIVAVAASHGLKVNCTTNAFWAETLRKAEIILKNLESKRLHSLGISVDDFHQEFIPVKNVAHAIKAAKKAHIKEITLSCTTTSKNRNMKYYCLYLNLLGVDLSGVNLLETVRMPIGRGAEYFPESDLRPLDEFPANVSLEFCFEKVLIDPEGMVFPCCNYFISPIGDMNNNSLDQMLEKADKNPYVQMLKAHGPVYLLHQLVDEGKLSIGESKFADLCHICAYIFQLPSTKTLLRC